MVEDSSKHLEGKYSRQGRQQTQSLDCVSAGWVLKTAKKTIECDSDEAKFVSVVPGIHQQKVF